MNAPDELNGGHDAGPGGRVLAVDLGARRLGLAVSDPLGLTAQGLPSLKRGRDPVTQILDLCRDWGVGSVIVGLPLLMNGAKGPQAVAAEEFAAALAARDDRLSVLTWDERLSSVAAEKVLIEGGVRRTKRRQDGLIDRGAATLVLQVCLDRRRGRGAR